MTDSKARAAKPVFLEVEVTVGAGFKVFGSGGFFESFQCMKLCVESLQVQHTRKILSITL